MIIIEKNHIYFFRKKLENHEKKFWKKMLKHGWSSYDFWKFRPSLSDAHVTLSEMDPSFRGVIWFVDVPLWLLSLPHCVALAWFIRQECQTPAWSIRQERLTHAWLIRQGSPLPDRSQFLAWWCTLEKILLPDGIENFKAIKCCQ